ncbi:histone [Candidatus Hodarchaeum mangrovi]
MVEIPNSSIHRIIRKSGVKRVSKSAIIALQKELEEYGLEISKIARDISLYSGKKTIDEKDINLAIWKFKLNK